MYSFLSFKSPHSRGITILFIHPSLLPCSLLSLLVPIHVIPRSAHELYNILFYLLPIPFSLILLFMEISFSLVLPSITFPKRNQATRIFSFYITPFFSILCILVILFLYSFLFSLFYLPPPPPNLFTPKRAPRYRATKQTHFS